MTRDIDIKIEFFHYGLYHIYAKYKGVEVNCTTGNIDCFIWLHNDRNKAKHERAYRHARKRIVDCYKSYKKNQKQND